MAVEVIPTCTKDRGALSPEGIVCPGIFVPAPIHAIERLEERRVDDMQFIRADSDNRACPGVGYQKLVGAKKEIR